MNKERYNQIIDEVYKKYADSHWSAPENQNGPLLAEQLWSVRPMEHSKETFAEECKTNLKFSDRWGLKIEERELSYSERFKIAYKNVELRQRLESESKMLHFPDGHIKVMNDNNIPKRLITLIYKDESIQFYE